MEVDSDAGLLGRVAAGSVVEKDDWPDLRSDIVARLEKIAHDEFPIPRLPAPAVAAHLTETRLMSPLPSSPLDSSQEANKENAPASSDAAVERETAPEPVELAPGELPKQIVDMLAEITSHLQTFTSYPPHTIQRLAELVHEPRAHYKALATYLHAVDRVVLVTSGIDAYPLPPVVPDLSAVSINGVDESKDPAATVAWSNPTTGSVGADEALGGALLTPIPWLTRRSPESNGEASGAGAQIHTEGTETIDGPNGMGSIETVSVSINGVSSTGHAKGVTQGELLRQEQRAGVVPVNQLPRTRQMQGDEDRAADHEDYEEEGEGEGEHPKHDGDDEDEEEETPHARGPEEIGVGDTGLQSATTSHVGEGGLEMRDIDVAAAVGRKGDAESASEEDAARAAAAAAEEADGASPGSETSGTKREAQVTLEGGTPKKRKDDNDDDIDDQGAGVDTADGKTKQAAQGSDEAEEPGVTDEGDADDGMDTDK